MSDEVKVNEELNEVEVNEELLNELNEFSEEEIAILLDKEEDKEEDKAVYKVQDVNGVLFQVKKSHPRYVSGELFLIKE